MKNPINNRYPETKIELAHSIVVLKEYIDCISEEGCWDDTGFIEVVMQLNDFADRLARITIRNNHEQRKQ